MANELRCYLHQRTTIATTDYCSHMASRSMFSMMSTQYEAAV